MSELLPRPIEFGDIKVGDRVRMTFSDGDIETSTTFTVMGYHTVGGKRECVYDSNGTCYYDGAGCTLELLERPKPESKPGWWHDPGTGVEYLTIRGENSFGPTLFVAFEGDYLYLTKVAEGSAVADRLEYVGEAVISIKDAESRDGAPASLDAPVIGVKES